MGRLLAGLSEQYKGGASLTLWFTRLGRLFSALVEVAVPRSFPCILFHHWLKLTYFLEVLLIVASTLFPAPPVQQFALVAFAITLAVHGVVLVLSDIWLRKKTWLVVLGSLFYAIVGLGFLLGTLCFVVVLGAVPGWCALDGVHSWAVDPQAYGKDWARRGPAGLATLFFLLVIRRDLRKAARVGGNVPASASDAGGGVNTGVAVIGFFLCFLAGVAVMWAYDQKRLGATVSF
jgi:hypothetical protein